MSIHAISGKPGGGKSLYTMRLIVDELVRGDRVVITNVAVKLGELNAYLQREFPELSIDVVERVRLLTDEQTSFFWTWRPGPAGSWVRIPVLSKREWEEKKKPSYVGLVDCGVMYVIDEAHNFFNARAWVETGRDVLFYLSQHRKLRDTVVWVTQAVDNVDKQFRSVSQDYTYLRNLSKERLGFFKLPARFIRRTFLSPANPSSKAVETGTFKLDVSGLASCYDTAQGVGIHGRAADQGERVRGIPWFVPVIVLPIVLFALYKFVPPVIARFFDVTASVKQASLPAAAKVPKVVLIDTSSIPQAITVKAVVTNAAVFSVPYVTGLMQIPNKDSFGVRPVVVLLSSGEQYTLGDGHCTFVSRRYAIIDGVTNWWRPQIVVDENRRASR